MNVSKAIKIVIIFSLLFSSPLFSQQRPQRFEKIIDSNAVPTPSPKYNNKSLSIDIGNNIEPVANEIYHRLVGNKFTQLDARYDNVKGIDGLFLDVDKNGVVRDVHVIETKTHSALPGDAKIDTSKRAGLRMQADVPQLTKPWVERSLKLSIDDYNKQIAQLREEIKKTDSKSDIKKMQKKLDTLVNENELRGKALKYVQEAEPKRYLVEIEYGNGKFKMEQTKILADKDYSTISKESRTVDKCLTLDKKKTLTEFSFLANDEKNLSHFEKTNKKNVMAMFSDTYRAAGLSEDQIATSLKKMTIDPTFSPNMPLYDASKVKTNPVDTGLGNRTKNINNNTYKPKNKHNYRPGGNKPKKGFHIKASHIACGIAGLTIYSQIHSILDFNEGLLKISDLVFASVNNSLDLMSVIINNPIVDSIGDLLFLTTTVAENSLDYKNGAVNGFYAFTNIATTSLAFLLSTASTVFLCSTFTPVIGAFLSVAASSLIFHVFGNIIRPLILLKYEDLKYPERFSQSCEYVKTHCKEIAI